MAVCCGHASTINNPGSLCNGGRNSIGEVCPDIRLSILSLSGGGDSASPDRPNWFVLRDNDLTFFFLSKMSAYTH